MDPTALGRRAVDAVRRGLPAEAGPTARGVAGEAGWFLAHAALYPFGVLSERGPQTRRRRPRLPGRTPPDPVTDRRPVLLVHGVVDNRSVFTGLRRALLRRGLGPVVTMNYSVLTSDTVAAPPLRWTW